MSIGGSVVRVNRRFFGGNGLGRALFPGCPRDNSRMDADLTPITVALAELGDTELHALHPIEATSHTFVGGRDVLLEQLRASLARVADRRSGLPAPSAGVGVSRSRRR